MRVVGKAISMSIIDFCSHEDSGPLTEAEVYCDDNQFYDC